MMISTKGRYALRVMVDIAENQRDGYIPLKEIAYRQDISEKYLEAIVKGLVKERYLTGLRGKSGGYRLTRAPEDYTVGAILRITEGSLAPVACLEQEHVDCPRMADCRTLPMWRKLNTRRRKSTPKSPPPACTRSIWAASGSRACVSTQTA